MKVLIACLFVFALCASADTLIDNFSVAQGPVEGDSWASGSGILGGTRYIHYDGTDSNYVEATSGDLTFVYGDISLGDYITISYDGGAGDVTPDYTGLGGVNLGGSDGFLRFSFNASTNIEIWIFAWTDQEHASATSGLTVSDSSTPFTFDVSYSSFNRFGPLGDADFSNIGALQIQILPAAEPSSSAEMNIAEIRAIPEPASAFLIIGIGIAGFFIRQRFAD